MADNKIHTNPTAAADVPEAAPLTPEEMVTQLRALLARVPGVPSLTQQERKLLLKNRSLPDAEVVASLDVARVSDRVTQAIGTTPEDARQLLDDAQNWGPVEREIRGVLKAVSDANLVRRQRASIIASQAYAIGQQLARDPENAGIVPHVLEVKRLKALRRRKATSGTGTPAPADTPPVSKTQKTTSN